jgi:hypothetical protein
LSYEPLQHRQSRICSVNVTLVPINPIEILNSRDRNMKVFEENVDNIRAIGLKKPITVSERPNDYGDPRYVLVCGEERLNAFRILGETHIPALVLEYRVKTNKFASPGAATARLRSWPTSRCCANAAKALKSSSRKRASHPSAAKTLFSCSTKGRNV